MDILTSSYCCFGCRRDKPMNSHILSAYSCVNKFVSGFIRDLTIHKQKQLEDHV